MRELRRARRTRSWKAKDILRAAQLEPLPADNEGVAAKLAKLREGKPLSPVLLVQREDGPLPAGEAGPLEPTSGGGVGPAPPRMSHCSIRDELAGPSDRGQISANLAAASE